MDSLGTFTRQSRATLPLAAVRFDAFNADLVPAGIITHHPAVTRGEYVQRAGAAKRLVAIGDIHGHLKALDVVLGASNALAEPDTLVVTLGDYVDRGPNALGVLERLLELHARRRLIHLRGNHDQMMIDALRNPGNRELETTWVRNGGLPTHNEYRHVTPVERGLELLARHLAFLDTDCVDFIELPSVVLVHGGTNPNRRLAETPRFELHWRRTWHIQPDPANRVVVCGHSPQQTSRPLDSGHVLCLDTGIGTSLEHKARLCAYDLHSGVFWLADRWGTVERFAGRPLISSKPCTSPNVNP